MIPTRSGRVSLRHEPPAARSHPSSSPSPARNTAPATNVPAASLRPTDSPFASYSATTSSRTGNMHATGPFAEAEPRANIPFASFAGSTSSRTGETSFESTGQPFRSEGATWPMFRQQPAAPYTLPAAPPEVVYAAPAAPRVVRQAPLSAAQPNCGFATTLGAVVGHSHWAQRAYPSVPLYPVVDNGLPPYGEVPGVYAWNAGANPARRPGALREQIIAALFLCALFLPVAMWLWMVL